MIKEEKRKYILQKFASSNSSKELFKTFNHLIGKKKNNSLSDDVPKHELPNTFNIFFTDKIAKMRNKLDQIPTQICYKKCRGPTLSSFTPVTEECARKIISKCKKKVLASFTHFLLSCFTNVLTFCYLTSLTFTMTRWPFQRLFGYTTSEKTLS